MKFKYVGIFDLLAILILYVLGYFLNIIPKSFYGLFPYILIIILSGIVLSIIFGSDREIKIKSILFNITFVIIYLVLIFLIYYLFNFLNLNTSVLSFIFILSFVVVFIYLVLTSIRDFFVLLYLK